MGLLDWNDEPDDLLPNFDAACAPPASTIVKTTSHDSSNSNTSSNDPRFRSVSNASSNASSSQLLARSRASTLSLGSSSSSQQHRKTRHLSRPKTPSTRKRSPSSADAFDLFGNDDELQNAESRIGFCDVCLKNCEIHPR